MVISFLSADFEIWALAEGHGSLFLGWDHKGVKSYFP
jgi:hypothetical protein